MYEHQVQILQRIMESHTGEELPEVRVFSGWRSPGKAWYGIQYRPNGSEATSTDG